MSLKTRPRNWLVVAVAVAMGFEFVSSPVASAAQAASAAPSRSAIVIKDALIKIVSQVEVPVEQAGVLAELHMKEGEIVEKDAIIGRLKDAEFRIQMDRAKLQHEIARVTAESKVDIEYATKSYQVAAAEVRRSEQANSRVANSIPLTRIEKQKLEKERTRLQLQQAERDFRIGGLQSNLAGADLRLAETQLKQTEIRSPVAGMVVAIDRVAGEWVQPGQTIAKIVAIDRLRMEGFVTAEDAGAVSIGTPVTVKFAQSWVPESVPGKVIFISPEANPVNLNVAVWVEIENMDRKLMPGLRGNIEIDR